ncbi:MAG: glycosyltransferase family 2 protein [Pseudomonadales bacterium]|nr:glycosyltransferase family 2 protein [Pseudomonadales bacterium]
MKISVFTSTFNRKEKLKRLVDSMLQQSYADWELLVVDDGSTDTTSQMMRELADTRFSYIRFNENLGHPEALFNANIVGKLAGELVIFIGSDDYFCKDAFESIIGDYSKLDNNVWKVGYLWKGEDSLDKDSGTFSGYVERTYSSFEVVSDTYKQVDYLFVYRKCYWEEFRNFFLSAEHFYSAFMDVALKCLYVEKHFPKYLIVAGWGEDNVTKGLNSEKYFKWALVYKKYIFDRYSGNMAANFKRTWLLSLIRSLCLHKGNKKVALPYIKLLLADVLKNVGSLANALVLLFLPSSLIFKAKQLIFKYRKTR